MKRLQQWVRCTTLAALVLGCGQEPRSDSPDLASQIDSGAPVPGVVDSAPTPSPPSPAADSVLTPDGWGGLQIGMTRAEVVAAAGEDAHPEAVGGPDPARCDEFRPNRAPDGLLVMIRNGQLARISITGSTGIVTSEGIAVGDSVAAVRQAYGSEAVSSPHAFHAAPAEYLTVWQVRPPSPSARGIMYEITDRGRVLRILAGDESIEYREGCV